MGSRGLYPLAGVWGRSPHKGFVLKGDAVIKRFIKSQQVLMLIGIVFLLVSYANEPLTVAPQRRVTVTVLTYHSVMSHEFYYPRYVENPWVLHEDVFYEQMRFLYENNFTSLSAEQFMGFLFYGEELPPNPILITFDDGYLDNYLFAAPIMRKFGFTGMNFLITGDIPESTPQTPFGVHLYMSAAELIGAADVFEYGSHTHAMHFMDDDVAALEFKSIGEIQEDIRQSFESFLTFPGFAYPFGRHSRNAINALRSEGVRFAFTTQWGYVNQNTNPFRLPRFSVASDLNMEQFIRIVAG